MENFLDFGGVLGFGGTGGPSSSGAPISQGRISALLTLVPRPSRSRGVRCHWADMTDGATEPAMDIESSAKSRSRAASGG